MSMFDSYRLTPSDYVPNNLNPKIDYIAPPQEKRPLVLYNKFDEPVGLTWGRSDNIVLEFNTTGEVIPDETGDLSLTAEQYLVGKKFRISILDWRYNVAYSCDVEAGVSVKFSINNVREKLVSGNYHLVLELIDSNNNIITALIENCNIFIK